MAFNILYVEDDDEDYRLVKEAADAYNATSESVTEVLNVDRAFSPEEMKAKLSLKFDLILADLYFKGGDRLEEVLKIVGDWAVDENAGRSIPIIAYTEQYSAGALKACLGKKKYLFDIWDKNTASPDYVTWRLSEISKEISRFQPDSYMQRLIRDMPGGVSWHGKVIEMAKRYNSGKNEYDQIKKAGAAIYDIMRLLGSWDQCSSMWDVIVKWEPLAQVVSKTARGHARHTINVFWLGYYIMHHAAVRNIFSNFWKNLLLKRSRMEEVKDIEPLEALSNVWFYTAFFHDVANCVEKGPLLVDFQQKLTEQFHKLLPDRLKTERNKEEVLHQEVNRLKADFDEPLAESLQSALDAKLEKKILDHGIIAGIHLRNIVNVGPQACFAREASRAVALHNVINDAKMAKSGIISWDLEPMGCLLLLCDQIQSWDRERVDQIDRYDEPERAELSSIQILVKEGLPNLRFEVNYISPKYLKYSPEIYDDVKERLKRILREKPERALGKISSPWPFWAFVNFYLDGDPMESEIKFS